MSSVAHCLKNVNMRTCGLSKHCHSKILVLNHLEVVFARKAVLDLSLREYGLADCYMHDAHIACHATRHCASEPTTKPADYSH